ncbi:signal transducer and activator of transcription 1-alpha/beta-like [Brachyistius frenatus]|uniref:signal transducer and activator of transcription 1-alpha/beta-like n=1 Tax=Brachyistius frenatus TaxID=100188 RepID=UPI0037E8AA37
MAQWQDLLRLDAALQTRVRQLYAGRFPREIRHSLCDWIEGQDWDSAAVDELKAFVCFNALLVFLEEQWKRSVEENNILQGPDFSWMKDYLTEHFENEPLNLARLLSECLNEEKKILNSVSERKGCRTPGMEKTWRELDSRVNELKRLSLEVKRNTKEMEGLNEKLVFVQEKWQDLVEQQARLASSEAVIEECHRRANFITQTKMTLREKVVNILKEADQIVETLTNVELPQWKLRQQMACIGSPVDCSVDNLQKWFTTVAEVLLAAREQLQKLPDQNDKYCSTNGSGVCASMAQIENFALSSLTKLLTNALVVEEQPIVQKLQQHPLILTTKVMFKATVRFLANLPEFKCLLKVKPVFDKDVEEVKKANWCRRFKFKRDDSKVLDVDTQGGSLMAEFQNMSIVEDNKRPKRPCTDRLLIAEELHIIKFVTEFQYAGLQCDIETSSLPVVVISSSSQAPIARASIMWWSMLSTIEPRNLSLFAAPTSLSWDLLSKALSWQFLSVGQRELDEDQLSMLRDKVVDTPDGLVHWSTFSAKEGPWVWIDGILDLVKKHLAAVWQDGSIMGFVSRERTRSLLENKPTGTFLLRFSESNKDGAITFSWVNHSSGQARVHAVEPYTKTELLSLSLPDIIYHYSMTTQKKTKNPLRYLYPNINKDTAFRRYYQQSAPSIDINGYLHRRLASLSIFTTSPPSPPSERQMEVDSDADTNSHDCQLVNDMISDLGDISPSSWPSIDLSPLSHGGDWAYPFSPSECLRDY